jgi:two-component system sensor histidine kinase KdpD
MSQNESRPNPDELLSRVKAEADLERRGKLKLFLGYAAGVGKTYTMLEFARQKNNERSIVVGYVETHGRKETEALLKGLEIIPPKKVEYRGVTLDEMDLDAILLRHPDIVVVDEYAHTNAQGSRHAKRYQDVEELLSAGIDVYTTLNIQHIESLRNLVAQVTDVWVRETVPDSAVDLSTEIELVDIPPDELIKRLQEGKVYVSDQVPSAIAKFFRKGNLSALRELAMRTAAQRVDQQSQTYMKQHSIRGPWPTRERLLVCISFDSLGTKLIRSARRLANDLEAEWSAIYIETPDKGRLSPEQQDQLADTMRLAQRLGAKTEIVSADSVIDTIIDYAGTHNITKVVIARPQWNNRRLFFNRPLADQIIRRNISFDVHIVSGGETMRPNTDQVKTLFGDWRGILKGLALVAAASVIAGLVQQLFTPANLVMIYLLCVVIAAVLWGFGPSVVVSIVGVLVFDFFFIPPFLAFTVNDTQYLFTFIVLLGVGLVISYLMQRIRRQTDAAIHREKQMATLYALAKDLAISSSLESYISAIVKRARETFGSETMVFLPDSTNKGLLKTFSDTQKADVGENEKAAAIWCYQHQMMAGYGTDTLPNAKARYLPLVTARGTVGVMSLSAKENDGDLTLEQERLLGAYADLTAVAIEGIMLGEEAHNSQVLSQVLRDTEKLQTALINSISHDLRTPLVSVIGVLSSLQEEEIVLDDASRKNMLQVAREEAERLNRLITNLLDVSRIEAGAMKLNRHPSEVQDLVGAAIEQLGGRTQRHLLTVDIPAELPFIFVDFGLIVQTLVNIVDNAVKYSPHDLPITIKARQIDQDVQIEISDRGPGIPAQDLSHVFEKYYRIQRPDRVDGTGLGLSICKGIIEAHGGRIEAKNRPDGGTQIIMVLPISKQNLDFPEKPYV